MKTLMHLPLVLFALSTLVTPVALADKMASGTQDLVVKKLDRVLDVMDPKDPAYVPTQQRLADLLAERARTRFMEEVEAGCDNCKGSKEDRMRAIEIYENLLTQVKVNEHGPLLFQLAHLHEMANQPDKAIALFERIIKEAKAKSIDPQIVSRSEAALGDLLFQKGKFKEAHAHYVTALKDKSLENRALATYNMAWCEFNTDQLNAAIGTLEGLLKDPSKITRDTEEASAYDPVFHADIVRDLGSFYARKNIGNKEINTYDTLCPDKNRKELLLNFAVEADRVGQKQAAHDILQKYLAQADLTKQERLEAFVRLAQVNYDRGQTTQSTQDFAKAAAAFKSSKCEDAAKCEELQKTMKRYVTELHRSKKLKPDQDLLEAYTVYTTTFPQDKEMIQRGSQVAIDMGYYAVAVQFYRAISENSAFTAKERNEALMNEVSAAEKSGKPELQRQAYAHFLKFSSDDEKSFEVRYQLAYLNYQEKKLKEAVKAFDELVHDKKGKMDLRKKSADLALDSLAQLKEDEQFQDKAWDYSETLPQYQNEFAVMARKALMNRVAAVANNPKSTKSELQTIQKAVLKTKLDGATNQERILIYTNLSIVAKKLGDDEVYGKCLLALIGNPEVSAANKEKYVEQLVGYYERKLDFANAYKTALKINNNKIAPKEMAFRLGTLADLAEINPAKHYKEALALGLKGDRALIVRSRLVVLSENPVHELKAQAGELRNKPALLSDTTLTVFAMTHDKAGLKSVLAMKELSRQPAKLYIDKQEFYTKLNSFQKEIAKHELNTSNDHAMGKTITQRTKLLAKADNMLADSIHTKDITAQMRALNIVAEENNRFVRDLSSLPIPKGLNEAQKGQYLEALKGKSRPFLLKARTAQAKMGEIWNQSPAIAGLVKDYRLARPEIQKLLNSEMQMLDQVPGKGKMKSALGDALNSSPYSTGDLASARKSVASNPDSVRDLEKLKTIETKIGHPLMPSYLEARLNSIQKGTSL